MSLLKDINDSNDVIKGKALILLLVPFWYFSLYLFNLEFYQKNDLILMLSFCFIVSLLSVFLVSYFVDVFLKKHISEYLNTVTASVIILIIWISFLIFSFYSLKIFLDIKVLYYWFILIYFTPIFVFILIKKLTGNNIVISEK